ncbi:MAG: hypothetical protein ABMA14_12910 [Hyphomonadaceae bacterium]
MRAYVFALAIALLDCPANAQAQRTLVCPVTRKLDFERIYTADELLRGQFRVEVVMIGETDVKLRRCSFAASVGKVTCDEYVPDHIAQDPFTGVIKFYHYTSHFDVQVFKDGRFVENNGRGSIAFGTCSSY